MVLLKLGAYSRIRTGDAGYPIPPADAVADVDGVADRIAWPTPA